MPCDICRLNTLAAQDYCGVVMKPKRRKRIKYWERRTQLDLGINCRIINQDKEKKLGKECSSYFYLNKRNLEEVTEWENNGLATRVTK